MEDMSETEKRERTERLKDEAQSGGRQVRQEAWRLTDAGRGPCMSDAEIDFQQASLAFSTATGGMKRLVSLRRNGLP